MSFIAYGKDQLDWCLSDMHGCQRQRRRRAGSLEIERPAVSAGLACRIGAVADVNNPDVVKRNPGMADSRTIRPSRLRLPPRDLQKCSRAHHHIAIRVFNKDRTAWYAPGPTQQFNVPDLAEIEYSGEGRLHTCAAAFSPAGQQTKRNVYFVLGRAQPIWFSRR